MKIPLDITLYQLQYQLQPIVHTNVDKETNGHQY